jgi:hypothetical protein
MFNCFKRKPAKEPKIKEVEIIRPFVQQISDKMSNGDFKYGVCFDGFLEPCLFLDSDKYSICIKNLFYPLSVSTLFLRINGSYLDLNESENNLLVKKWNELAKIRNELNELERVRIQNDLIKLVDEKLK